MHSDSIRYWPDSYDPEDEHGNPIDWSIHRNGDYSGDAHILVSSLRVEPVADNDGDVIVRIPNEVLFEYVGRALQSKDISEIERKNGMERLGFKRDQRISV